jgi:hypothetical protein
MLGRLLGGRLGTGLMAFYLGKKAYNYYQGRKRSAALARY